MERESAITQECTPRRLGIASFLIQLSLNPSKSQMVSFKTHQFSIDASGIGQVNALIAFDDKTCKITEANLTDI
jgi:hypothetical protein